MLDRDEANDLSFRPYSPLNPEGLVNQYDRVPTDGLNTRTAIPLVELDWHPHEMPKIPSKKKPPEFRRVSQWHSAQWNGQTVFRGVVCVDLNKKRFVFYVPSDFPLRDTETIEEQCQYYKQHQQ